MNDAEQPQFSKRWDKFHRSSTDRVYCSQTLRRYKLELALGALADLDNDSNYYNNCSYRLHKEVKMKIQITRKEYTGLLNYFLDLKSKPCIGCENNDGSCCGCESEKAWSKTMAGYSNEVKKLAEVQIFAVYFDSIIKAREIDNRIYLLKRQLDDLRISCKGAQEEFTIIEE